MNNFKDFSRIYFGKGSAANILGLIIKDSLRKPLFIIDKNLKNLKYIDEILSQSGNEVVIEVLYVAVDFEPTYDLLDEIKKEVQEIEFDCVVGIGGGSICDIAKAIGVLANNPGPSINYRGVDLVKNPGKQVILIPTTAGTGTEATKTASFIDAQEKKKMGINGKNVDVLFSILDPIAVMSCPISVKISSGLDAMLHAVEAITARTSTVLSKIQGISAFKLLYDNFPLIMRDNEKVSAYTNMLLGSYLAGVAMFNAGGGPASGISYPLGVHFNVPHGIAGGIFLQKVFEYNVDHGYKGYDELYVALTHDNDRENKGRKFVDMFREFYDEIGAPKTLNNFNVGKKDMDRLVNLTVEQRMENLKLNPIEFGRNETRDLLEAVLQ